MLGRLFLLMVIVPLLDLALLIWLARYTGITFTVCLAVLTAAIGAWLARQQGSAVRSRFAERLQQNQLPTELLSDGAMILLASGMLLSPGLLTDLFGFSLLTPLCRKWYKQLATKWFKKNFKVHVIKPDFGGSPHQDPNTVDGEVVRSEPSDAAPATPRNLEQD